MILSQCTREVWLNEISKISECQSQTKTPKRQTSSFSQKITDRGPRTPPTPSIVHNPLAQTARHSPPKTVSATFPPSRSQRPPHRPRARTPSRSFPLSETDRQQFFRLHFSPPPLLNPLLAFLSLSFKQCGGGGRWLSLFLIARPLLLFLLPRSHPSWLVLLTCSR